MRVKITLESPNPKHYEALLKELAVGQECYGAEIVEIEEVDDIDSLRIKAKKMWQWVIKQ